MDVVGCVVEDEIAVGLGWSVSAIILFLWIDETHTFGKQSLSNTKACSNCPVATGISNQLPHHHGFSLNHPSSSNALYASSSDLVAIYIAIVSLN